jgi:hypothetical protein
VSDQRHDRLQALGALQSADRTTRAEALRPRVLDPEEDPIVRAAAIALLAHDGTLDPDLQIESAAPLPVVAAVAKAAEIRDARHLIASAVAGEDLPSELFDVPALPLRATRSVDVVLAPEEERRALARLVAESPHPIAPALAEVPMVTLGRCGWAILVDPAVRPESLLERPARPASVAVRDLVDDVPWAIPLEVVTAPRGNAVAIAVLDRRGRTRYVGSGSPADDATLEITVQAADRPGSTPLRLAARLHAGRLEISRVERGVEPGPRLRPSPLPP